MPLKWQRLCKSHSWINEAHVLNAMMELTRYQGEGTARKNSGSMYLVIKAMKETSGGDCPLLNTCLYAVVVAEFLEEVMCRLR